MLCLQSISICFFGQVYHYREIKLVKENLWQIWENINVLILEKRLLHSEMHSLSILAVQSSPILAVLVAWCEPVVLNTKLKTFYQGLHFGS